MNLSLTKPIIFFDLETTGLNISQDRIVEISILKVLPDQSEMVKTYLVSPADGRISAIQEINGPAELGLDKTKFTRVSIFMNVFDCHVNRAPSNGEIQDIFYKPGKFLNASLDKASEENERNYFKIKDNKTDNPIIVVQIAGLIARRIVTQVEKTQKVSQGQRLGMIRFGSRVDIYYSQRKTMVKIGQNVIAGESLIASS